MIDHAFAALTRSAALASRRDISRALAGLTVGGMWSALLGITEADAKKNRRKRKKRKKRKNKKRDGATSPPPPPPPPPCTPACAGKVCGDDGCGSSCGACGAGQLCSLGACVTGQGTCAAGDDICISLEHTCSGSGPDCRCMTSMANQTRCGIIFPLSGCGTCLSDAECAAANPGVAGVFCQKLTGENCACGEACFAPCPLE